MANHKTEGPATELSFLGILTDTNRFQLRLPTDKLARLRLLVAGWQSRRSCTRIASWSHLSHAAIVIQHGKIFLATVCTSVIIRLNRLVCSGGTASSRGGTAHPSSLHRFPRSMCSQTPLAYSVVGRSIHN